MNSRHRPQRYEWIRCLGALREVRAGTVDCPLSGRAEVEACLHCHALETLAGERRRDVACSTESRAERRIG